MRPITIPAALWPFMPESVVGRPWWTIAGRTPNSIRYVRMGGEHIDIPNGADLATTVQAMAVRDSRRPLPPPPPCETQVWACYDGKRLVKRTVLASQIEVVDNASYSVVGVLWSEQSFDDSQWPPPGAQLLDGPFAPWSPAEGVTLAAMNGDATA